MKKRLLSVAIAASLSIGAMDAYALADRTLNAQDSTKNDLTVNYTSTIDVSSISALVSAGTTLDLKVLSKAGVGFGETRYVRFDFTNTVFATNDLAGANNLEIQDSSGNKLVAPTATANGYDFTINSVSGHEGKQGESHVIFSIKVADDDPASIYDQAIPSTSRFVFKPGASSTNLGINNTDTITYQYRLYEKEVGASDPDNNYSLVSDSGDYVRFFPPYEISMEDATQVADVAEDYTRFLNGKKKVVLAYNIKFAKTDTKHLSTDQASSPNLLLPDGTTEVSTLSDILKDTTSLEIKGDFSALASPGGVYDNAAKNRVFLGATGCVTDTAASLLSAESATITIGNVASTAADSFLCIETNTGIAATENGGTIPVSTYSASLNAVPITGQVALEFSNIPAGVVKRNGAQLITPFFTLNESYTPRFYLINRSNQEAAFKIALGSDASKPISAGEVTEGTIPANGALLLKGPQIATPLGGRGSAVFTVNAPCKLISGVFQNRTNTTSDPNIGSGDFDSIPMQMPQGICK
ncbi:hypothetical protein QUF61_16640 [Candidatus Venteria ishoeyi]|uniref:hypothetical protein n=1 Tax=Candidatus Venteria ishoeyi TaxID=1899563 RepID=UPI0025A59712|nr:hypothetical protein [Candidatus Venteria ishoeyi]MDM8548118.1 hypothetical protein [Candidatus Venteria ishoeyi]